MGLWDFVKSELIDIVEWLDSTGGTMVYRFERHDNEIKNGAQLIVRPGQTAVFVDQGQIADVFAPGRYELKTENLPLLSTLQGWKYGFNSPFKAEVYFVNTKVFTDLKWGTKNPIMLRDPEFGPVRLRAFGTYAIRVSEPGKFIAQIVGTSGVFTVDGISDQIRNFIVSRFTEALGEGKIPALDLAANYSELGQAVRTVIAPEVADYGLEVTTFLVENISLPEEVEKALDKRTSMGVIGNLGAYTQFQAANAIEAAAKNPGGGAGEGMGLGMGFAMAQQMANAMGGAGAPSAPAGGPPPLPGAAQFYIAMDGKQAGPFGPDVLRGHASAGQLTRETLVWKQGMDTWKPAGEVADLQPIFGAAPPPLPPV
ncbi:SPFH domain-containing protein [Longimicrobium terrae]|uniref:Membrane protease subunit (Stomatin/prohibitin family) n=1 Tax=Longimicrobium terrae TaxID=1639882 RepID=A0A841H2A0_9BACT|nr:SPFH domain-containing protein [Longimicrobium terrae]MBB4637733.1 membrane protease subunit (stomatin/prohibitin family) [Longimicrobium terrae]MBB6072130.1 membrane protease subunit (stomatin/prohibitin family) [Longimicrobium terrae]NNC29788.1 SPFH domain-containing protein [Longimicrobium terrae]